MTSTSDLMKQTADDLVKAAESLRALATQQTQAAPATVVRTARVGQAIGRYASRAEIRSFLDSLPAGTQFEDRDGDRYTQHEVGYDYWEREGGVNPADYAPLTVTVVPSTPVTSPTLRTLEPAATFDVYDGDRFTVEFCGTEVSDVVTVKTDNGRTVWVDSDQARALIAYLQQCLAFQGENVTPF